MRQNSSPLLVTLCALAGLVIFVLGALLTTRLVSFEPDLPPLHVAIAVEATVITAEIVRDAAGPGKDMQPLGQRRMLHYAFLDKDGGLHSADAEVSAIYYTAHPPGSRVTAYHFPGRPDASVLDNPALLDRTASHWGQLIGGLLMLLGGWAAVRLGDRAMIARRGYGWL